jgi:heme/copper-type cytochrome/quinol oxidase subunit 2
VGGERPHGRISTRDIVTTIFWASGIGFFVVQLVMLLHLLRIGRGTGATPEERLRHQTEVIWTLVPASLVAVLALMLGGLVDSPWSGNH